MSCCTLLSSGNTLCFRNSFSPPLFFFLFVLIQWISALRSTFFPETVSSSEGEGLAPSLCEVDEEYTQSPAKEPGEHVRFESRHCFDKEGMCVLSLVCITETKHLTRPISDFIQVFHHSAHVLYRRHFSSSFSLNSIQSCSHSALVDTSCTS